MGYYHIRLSKEASNTRKTILSWDKYRYKRLHMGVSNFMDILQDKMNEMVHIFYFIGAYTNDLVIINKGDWYNHLEKLDLMLQKFRYRGLNCKVEKFFLVKLIWNS